MLRAEIESKGGKMTEIKAVAPAQHRDGQGDQIVSTALLQSSEHPSDVFFIEEIDVDHAESLLSMRC